jgi:hypothetical protein
VAIRPFRGGREPSRVSPMMADKTRNPGRVMWGFTGTEPRHQGVDDAIMHTAGATGALSLQHQRDGVSLWSSLVTATWVSVSRHPNSGSFGNIVGTGLLQSGFARIGPIQVG